MTGCVMLFAILFSSLTPDGDPSAAALRQLAPHLVRFRTSESSPGTNAKRLNDLIAKLHLAPHVDRRTRRQVPGLAVWPEGGVLPVKGMRGGTYTLLSWGTTEEIRDLPDNSARVLFRPVRRNGRLTSVPEIVDDSDHVLPSSVVACGNLLAVAGYDEYWNANASVTLRVYEKDGAEWRHNGSINNGLLAGSEPKLRLSRNGRSIMPLRFISINHADFLYTGRSTHALTYEDEWVVRDGKPQFASRRRRDTPFNTLDRIYGAIEQGDAGYIRGHSLNSRIARRLDRMRGRTKDGNPTVRFPHSVCDPDGTTIGIVNLEAAFHFRRVDGRWVVARIGPLSELD